MCTFPWRSSRRWTHYYLLHRPLLASSGNVSSLSMVCCEPGDVDVSARSPSLQGLRSLRDGDVSVAGAAHFPAGEGVPPPPRVGYLLSAVCCCLLSAAVCTCCHVMGTALGEASNAVLPRLSCSALCVHMLCWFVLAVIDLLPPAIARKLLRVW